MAPTQTIRKTNQVVSERGELPWPWRIRSEFCRVLLEEGRSPEQAAAYWDVHPRTVRRWARRHGVEKEVYDATG